MCHVHQKLQARAKYTFGRKLWHIQILLSIHAAQRELHD